MNENGGRYISWKWLVGLLVTLLIGFAGGAWSSLNHRVESIEQEHVVGQQRIATLEEAIRTMKDDSTIIKQDVKNLLQLVGKIK